jgi:hypothetical protein
MSVLQAWQISAIGLCCVSALACATDAPLTAAAPPRESVQEVPSVCARTEACGGDPVGRWRILSMCTRAPEITFDAYTSLPHAKCRGQMRAAELEAEGSLEVSDTLALRLDYEVQAQLTIVWSARCLDAEVLEDSHCQDVADALRARSELQELECALRELDCVCRLRPSLHVEAADLEGARELFGAGEQCVMGERMSLDDGSATLIMERAA